MSIMSNRVQVEAGIRQDSKYSVERPARSVGDVRLLFPRGSAVDGSRRRPLHRQDAMAIYGSRPGGESDEDGVADRRTPWGESSADRGGPGQGPPVYRPGAEGPGRD